MHWCSSCSAFYWPTIWLVTNTWSISCPWAIISPVCVFVQGDNNDFSILAVWHRFALLETRGFTELTLVQFYFSSDRIHRDHNYPKSNTSWSIGKFPEKVFPLIQEASSVPKASGVSQISSQWLWSWQQCEVVELNHGSWHGWSLAAKMAASFSCWGYGLSGLWVAPTWMSESRVSQQCSCQHSVV